MPQPGKPFIIYRFITFVRNTTGVKHLGKRISRGQT